ncbi:TRAP transporter permease [Bacillus sp. Marseille-P3661]|uniref:TRAP transporter permease n=1 Tax=Bacillus sp. Marseille-P3661 TaxID=1936234 RepID=UPI000C854F08|nr:TRAP transporter fused permease subunit [Bacillus sp. Marseille-P3661]
MDIKESVRFRPLTGPVSYLWRSLLILITVSGILFILSVHERLGLALTSQQYAGWFLMLMLPSIFIGVPSRKTMKTSNVPWYDWIFAFLGVLVGGYIVIFYPQVMNNFGSITPARFILATLTIILVLEGIRRTFGWVLISIVLVFLAYAFVAPYMPGVFRGQSTSIDLLLNYLYLDVNSLLSLIELIATMGLAFILFGQILINFKGGDIFNNIALWLFGRFRGGPAKVAVAGSGLMGSITGGPVENVMLTGNISIPLMKKSGYSSTEAGAIESIASSGGSITPPIMGIVAFLIAENLAMPYAEVALAAVIPAVLYYFSIFLKIDLEAGKKGIGKLSKEEMPELKPILKRSWIVVLIFGLFLYMLFVKGSTPELTGLYASGVAFLLLLSLKEVRKDIFKKVIQTLEQTAQMAIEVGIILAAAGFVVGILSVTGLAFNLISALTNLGGYGLVYLLLGSAIVCVIMGMGMPAIAAYSIVAVLVAPTLVELGVPAIAAHLFVFYFSIVSHFTPPIALACFAASTIAKANPFAIGVKAMKLGVMIYIVPFLFVFYPSILLNPETVYNTEFFVIVMAIFAACTALIIGMTGYLFGPISTMRKVLFFACAALLLVPISYVGIIGAVLLLSLIVHDLLISKVRKSVPSESVEA